jgi:hypothetical protein
VAGEFLLRLDRALHGFDDAGKFGDDCVAPGVDHPPLVALDQRRHGGAPPAQRRQRACFIRPHEAGVSRSIRAKKRRQPPPDLVRHGVILAQKSVDGAADQQRWHTGDPGRFCE